MTNCVKCGNVNIKSQEQKHNKISCIKYTCSNCNHTYEVRNDSNQSGPWVVQDA